LESERFSLPGWSGELASGVRPLDLRTEIERLTDPAGAIRTLHWGRNYLYVARMATGAGPLEVVVKQFRHSSWRSRMRRRLRGSKAARSWRMAHALVAAGLSTPEPVLWLESEREDGPAFYVCRLRPEATEARYLFRAAAAHEEAERFPAVDFPAFVAAIGRFARRLHDAGFWHRDLSGGNLLLRFGADRLPSAIDLVDLNRMRAGRPPSTSERLRDLARLALFRREHQDLLLKGYWGEPAAAHPVQSALYGFYHRAFLLKNDAKKRLRAVTGALRKKVLPRKAHAHIPDAPHGASLRDQVVWDHLSDQPHQHAGRLAKLKVRVADVGDHLIEASTVAGALPRIAWRYRRLKANLYRRPVAWEGAGVALRPFPEDPAAQLALLDELRVQHVLLRLHPWEEDHDAEEALARALAEGGCELTFALPQNRDLVRDKERWRRKVAELGERFAPFGPRFQIGQAINRSKWGIWSVREYLELARAAEEILRRNPKVEILGPSVIDFEYHVTAAVLNLRKAGVRFDAVAALLYVDRRGAPENRQAGFDTVDKVVLLRAIAETARHATPRCWITEVNWPLREGPHSPAGRAVSVDEEAQANYLVRYYLLTLGTGLVERVFWWQLIARGYGLVDPADPAQLRRRPSFFALKTLLAQLGGATFEGPLEAPIKSRSPVRLYRFRRPDLTQLVVGWSANDQTAKAVLPSRPVAVLGRGGEELPVPAGAEVEVGASPRYFLL
jgi:tRNA A-37 threonylcarbamoyl transferase component Bud32